jgi:SUMO ligase MMS21 Smc5/6 complex component
LGLFYIFYRFTDPFVPKSCVQGLCVATEKKRDEERIKKQKKFLQFKKILLLKKKVVVTETKERKSKKKRKREKQKVSIRAAVLSLYCLFYVTTFVSRLASLSKV